MKKFLLALGALLFATLGALAQANPNGPNPWPYGPFIIDTNTIPATICVGHASQYGANCQDNPSGIVGSWDGKKYTPLFNGAYVTSVLAYGVDRTGSTDVSTGLGNAINAANAAFGLGPNACIYFPAGTYYLNGPLPSFTGPGCVIGDGPLKTIIKTGPNFYGTIFSWSEAWVGGNGSYPFNGNTLNVSGNRAGPILSGLSLVGNRSYSQQNAIAYLDHVDFGIIDKVDVFYMNGSAFSTGKTSRSSNAWSRESHISNFRVWNSGNAASPVMDLETTVGGGDGTNEILLNDIDIYANYGIGLKIGPNVREINGNNIRIEGIEGNPTGIAADLIQIGTNGVAGTTNQIHLHGLDLIDPYVNYAALHVAGSDGTNTYALDFEGKIGGGNPLGKGLQIDIGHNNLFRFPTINASGTDLTIGAGVSSTIIDGAGNQSTWTIVNNNTLPIVSFFPLQNQATGADAFAYGTGAIGASASSIALGANNKANNAGSVILGGSGAADRGRTGWIGSGAGSYLQIGTQGIFATATGTAEVPLRTINGFGPCITTDNTTFGLKIDLAARDITNPTNVLYWSMPGAVLTRDVGAGSTRYLSSPAIINNGLGNGASAGIRTAADTTGACVYVAFTPPAGNTDTWHIGGTIQTSEIQ